MILSYCILGKRESYNGLLYLASTQRIGVRFSIPAPKILNMGYLIMKKPLYKPGEVPKKTGEYIEVGPRGGEVGDSKQITLDDKTDKLPPTSDKGHKWKKK